MLTCPDPGCAELNPPDARYCCVCGKALLPFVRSFRRGRTRLPQRDVERLLVEHGFVEVRP
jgi:hypothetical protein